MRSRILLVGAALVVAAGAAVIGCSKDKSNNPYNPNPIPPGGTTLNLNLPANGGSASFTFNTAGTVPYRCGIHPTIMVGNSVNVSATSTTDSVLVNVVGTSTPGFNPSSVTIKVGGKVRWVNPTSMLHSVENN